MPPRPPDFLCIGAAKAGTTWLYSVLKACPGYWMPPVKELRYFGRTKALPRDGRVLASIESFERRSDAELAWVRHFANAEPKDDEWYYQLFADAGEHIAGDVSPSYGGLPTRFLQHAKSVVPRAHIVMMVRNPADRHLSHALHLAARRVLGDAKGTSVFDILADHVGIPCGEDGDRSLALLSHYEIPWSARTDLNYILDVHNRATNRALDIRALRALAPVKFTIDDVREALEMPIVQRQGNQAMAIRQWQDAFRERFHVWLYDDLVNDPSAFLAKATTTLGTPSVPSDPSMLSRNFNPGDYDVAGLEALRAELKIRYARETDELQEALGHKIPAWQVN